MNWLHLWFLKSKSYFGDLRLSGSRTVHRIKSKWEQIVHAKEHRLKTDRHRIWLWIHRTRTTNESVFVYILIDQFEQFWTIFSIQEARNLNHIRYFHLSWVICLSQVYEAFNLLHAASPFSINNMCSTASLSRDFNWKIRK